VQTRTRFWNLNYSRSVIDYLGFLAAFVLAGEAKIKYGGVSAQVVRRTMTMTGAGPLKVETHCKQYNTRNSTTVL
jgi:hypothetical protein